MVLFFNDFRERLGLHDGFIAHNCAVYVISLCYTHFTNGFTEGSLILKNIKHSYLQWESSRFHISIVVTFGCNVIEAYGFANIYLI